MKASPSLIFASVGLLLIMLSSGCLGAAALLGDFLFVSPAGTDAPGCIQAAPCRSLQFAVDNARDGDQIFLSAGIWEGQLNVNITTRILSIIGSGQESTILNGLNQMRGFLIINSTVVLRDLSIINGRATQSALQLSAATAGGAVLASMSVVTLERVSMRDCISPGASSAGPAGCLMSASSTLAITDSSFVRCRAGIAAGIYLIGSSDATITNSTFHQCTTDEGGWGGALVPEALTKMVVDSCTFTENYAGYGGSIDDGGDANWVVKNSLFQDNSALYGGAIYTFGNAISRVEGSKFIRNMARNSGGAVRTTSSSFSVFDGCWFERNTAASGGAVSVFSENVTHVINSVFFNNSAQSFGGALDSHYPMVMRNTSFIENQSATGAVYIIGTIDMSIDNTTFEGNKGLLGAGLFIEAAADIHRTFNNLRFIRNEARLSGGGFQLSGLSRTTFNTITCENNTASIGGCFMAAQSSTMHINDGSIAGNTAIGRGGAGDCSDSSKSYLSDVVIARNTAGSMAGAILVDGDAQLSLNNVIIDSNKARYGAGIALSEVASHCVNVSGVRFSSNSADVAGGAFFFDAKTPVCSRNFCDGCSFVGNTAVYGNDLTTKPSQISFTTVPPTSLSPSQLFSTSLELRDYFGVVVKNVRDYVAQVRIEPAVASTNATLAGLLAVDVGDNGAGDFTLLKVLAMPGTQARLIFSTFPATMELSVDLTIDPCSPTSEAYISAEGNYACLTRVDTYDPVRWTFVALAAVSCLLALLVLLTVIVNRTNTILRKASIMFCCFIAVGSLLMFASVFAFQWNNDLACALRPWLLVLGFGLCYGSLFIKEWRLWRMFDDNINTRVRISDKELLKGLSVLMVGEVGFLIIWFAVSPFVSQRTTNLLADTITYQCGSSLTSAVFWVLVAFNGLLLVTGCVVAFLVRNLPDNWNESRYMAWCIYSTTLTIVVCLSICGVLYAPNTVSLVASIGIIFSTLTTLLGLFVPKFMFVFFEERMRQSLEDDIQKLHQDIRWKQRQLMELDSRSRVSTTVKSRSRHSTRARSKRPSNVPSLGLGVMPAPESSVQAPPLFSTVVQNNQSLVANSYASGAKTLSEVDSVFVDPSQMISTPSSSSSSSATSSGSSGFSETESDGTEMHQNYPVVSSTTVSVSGFSSSTK